MAPSANQNILHARASFSKITLVPAAVVNAPPNLNMKTASESPSPSNVSSPATDPAIISS